MTFVTNPPSKGTVITLGELISGLLQYMSHIGVNAGRYEFEACPSDRYGFSGATALRFYNIEENGVPWTEHRYIFTDLDGKACRVLTSRIGAGPFDLLLVATRENAYADEEFRVVADIVVNPKRDRSLEVNPRNPPREYAPGRE